LSLGPGASSLNDPNIQKKNIAYLKAQTDLLKAQRKYMEEVNKSKKEDWEAMTEATQSMVNFSARGGFNMLFGGSINRLESQVSDTMDGALAPIVNELSSTFDTLVEDSGVKTMIQNFSNALGGLIDFIFEKQEEMKEKNPEHRNAWEELMSDLNDQFNAWDFIWKLITGEIKAAAEELAGTRGPDPTTPSGPGHYLPPDKIYNLPPGTYGSSQNPYATGGYGPGRYMPDSF
jgi:hypothetical protein